MVKYILERAHNGTRDEGRLCISDMICIAFFYLLRPGEYTGVYTDDDPFEVMDVALHLDNKRLDLYQAPVAQILAATTASHTFTTQKNGRRGEVITHGRSGHGLCCPVRATIRRVLHHRAKNSPLATPLASHYNNKGKRVAVKPKDVTDILRQTVAETTSQTGLHPSEVSARSMRAGGAMALLCGNIDPNIIQMLGRWHSDSMMRYLHLQARPIMKRFAQVMYNGGNYDFLPEETVPIANE